jgi:F-type H+-transporting ATPase subunit a
VINLFSIFDPTTEINNLPLNWTRTTIGLLLIPTRIWLVPSRNNIIVSLLISKLHQEIKTILRKGNENKGNSFILASLFLIILINNFLGLFPYIFTSTRHLTLTLTLALPIWIRFILFGWIKNTNHMFEHLVSQGTPTILIPFIVIIETIRNITDQEP